jgi:PAS domain S-box-containing protein
MRGAEEWCRLVHLAAGSIALLIGITNLLVWLGPTRFLSDLPGFMVVRVNTAICISSAALSLLLWYWVPRRKVLRRIAIPIGWIVATIAGLTASQDLLAISLGIDQLLGPTTFPGDLANRFVVHPGRMSLNAALSLCFIGLALANLDRRVRFCRWKELHIAPVLTLIAALPAASGAVGYLVGSSGFTGLLRSTNILLHAAIALVLLAVGTFAARPYRWPLLSILSSGADGLLLRWLLPGSAMLLITLGWLISLMARWGQLGAGEGTALMLYAGLILLSILIFGAGKAVARQESAAIAATNARLEGESRFRTLADNISQLAWMTDETGHIVWVNQRWLGYTGTSAEQIEQRGWESLVHPDHSREVVEKLQSCFREGLPWEDAFPMRRADGEFRWFLSRAMPIRDEAGKVQRWFGTHTDVTEQRELSDKLVEAKEQAERASQAKDDFLAALSHELRTPLTPVLLSAAALSEDTRLPMDSREELKRMERNIALEGKLIDDLLDLTRITRGKLLLRQEVCNVHTLINYVVAIIQSEAESKGVMLDVQLEAQEGGLHGDPARLQQIFWNVMKNAVKFTPAGGYVKVRSCDSTPKGNLIVEVSDNGLGFDPEAAKRLFEPFQQEKAAPEHRFGGLGLGLSISSAVAEAHGGTISAKSAGLGKGAIFTISLPGAFKPRLPESTAPQPVERTSNPPVSLNVVLVEDHHATLEILTRLLRQQGHSVGTAGDVAAARQVIDRERCDVLISDLGLPDGTGLEVMRYTRSRHPRVRGIALSGYGMESDLARSKEAGFDAHLVKPVDFAEVLLTLKRLAPDPAPDDERQEGIVSDAVAGG